MATYLRRKLAGLMKKDETPPSLTVTRAEGAISFTKKELQRYTLLFTMLDHDSDDAVGGAEGAFFLRRSGLTNEQLREVWRLASGGSSKPKLAKDDWLVACKLVAAVQYKGVEPSIAHIAGPAAAAEGLPLADFHYDTSAEIEAAGAATGTAGAATPREIEAAAIGVRVTNPTSFGSGLSKHTRYNVVTSTTLTQHFPHREMGVWRRYSDFEWLHSRLSVTFPAAIIPLFPEKRVLGNSDDSFVAARQAALEAYLSKVVHHPSLVTSLDLLVFLSASDSGLEAARAFIEVVAAEEAESFLAKAADAVASVAARDGVEKLALKLDEAFIAACATHGAALARLAHVVRAGNALTVTQHDHADKVAALGRALVALAAHERKHASAGTSAAAAVAAAAASSKRAEAALFSGTAGGGAAAPTGADAAAAAAFANHSAAANADNSSIESMFKADFHDPYSALHAVTPVVAAKPAASAAVYTGGYAEYLPDLLNVFGNELVAASARSHEQIGQLEDVLLKQLRSERDKEAELGEAIKRREAAIDRVHEAHATLQRKKKALASLKSTAPDYHAKAHEASAAVEKADKALAARREELDRMTDVLKAEMARTNKARRATAVARLAEYAKMSAAQARQRADAWGALLPAISNDSSAVDASREGVAAIARKAEAKARAAAAARKTPGAGGAAAAGGASAGSLGGAGAPAAATGGAGTGGDPFAGASGAAAATAAGGMGVGVADSAAMPVFADDAPIPTAAEL